jgi:hypothetical protein
MKAYCGGVPALYGVEALIISTFVVDSSGQVHTLSHSYGNCSGNGGVSNGSAATREIDGRFSGPMQWAMSWDAAALPAQMADGTVPM